MTFNNIQKQNIIDWYNEGLSYNEIAQRIGTSRSSIFRYVQLLKTEGLIVDKGRSTSQEVIKDQKEKIIEWYNEGLSYKEMARRLGVSYSIIEYRITSMIRSGTIKNSNHPKTEQNELDKQYRIIAIWHKQGLSRKEMADTLSVSVSTIGNRIATLRKKGIITTYNKPGNKKNNINMILAYEKSISESGYPKDEVHKLLNLYIQEKLYKDAIILLDYYCDYNILSVEELVLISQLQAKLRAKILDKLDNELEK